MKDLYCEYNNIWCFLGRFKKKSDIKKIILKFLENIGCDNQRLVYNVNGTIVADKFRFYALKITDSEKSFYQKCSKIENTKLGNCLACHFSIRITPRRLDNNGILKLENFGFKYLSCSLRNDMFPTIFIEKCPLSIFNFEI